MNASISFHLLACRALPRSTMGSVVKLAIQVNEYHSEHTGLVAQLSELVLLFLQHIRVCQEALDARGPPHDPL
jgi:hypothetical protein